MKLFASAVLCAAMTMAATRACDCEPRAFPDCSDDLVIHGFVETNDAIECSDDLTISKVRVLSVLRQSSEEPLHDHQILQVRSSTNPDECGVQLEPGFEYILFPVVGGTQEPCENPNDQPDLTVSLCSEHILQPSQEQLDAIATSCAGAPRFLLFTRLCCRERLWMRAVRAFVMVHHGVKACT